MKTSKILAVGRIKTKYWQEAAEHYRKRIGYTIRLTEEEVRDADAKLTPEGKSQQESERLLKLCKPIDILISLDETGKEYTSKEFAMFLGKIFDQGKNPCFMVGGAYGLTTEAKAQSQHSISLGAMTFPHELARVILLEQLYRAETILLGTGYHH